MATGNGGSRSTRNLQTGSQSNAGIKVSQFGYDVRTAKDYQLLFDSSWKSQQIIWFGEYVLTERDIESDYKGMLKHGIIFRHYLGKPYMAQAWFIKRNGAVLSPVMCAVSKNYATVIGDYSANSLKNGTLEPGARILCLVYNIDITEKFRYEFDFGGGDGGNGFYDNNVGFKVPARGKNGKSKNLQDYNFHSRGSSPMLLYCGTNDEYHNPSRFRKDGERKLYIAEGELYYRPNQTGVYRAYGYELSMFVDNKRIGDDRITYVPMNYPAAIYGAQDLGYAGFVVSKDGDIGLKPNWGETGSVFPDGATITNSLIIMRSPIDRAQLEEDINE